MPINSPDAGFWLMGKVDVNGPLTHPVYEFLKKHSSAGDIQWNFATKFLVTCIDETCDISRHDGAMASDLMHDPDQLKDEEKDEF